MVATRWISLLSVGPAFPDRVGGGECQLNILQRPPSGTATLCRRRLCHPERQSCLSQATSDRLMTLRLVLRGTKFATIVSVCVSHPPPLMSSYDGVKNKSYQDLQALLTTGKTDKLIRLGD
ncbi:hypothetical protein SprV_0100317000 [Sparganum proliferum]